MHVCIFIFSSKSSHFENTKAKFRSQFVVEIMATKSVVKKSATKKPKAPKSSSHPSYFEMIKEAISALKEKSGSSPHVIAKYMEEKHKAVLPPNFRKVLGVQLKNSVAKGNLIKIKASFKLSESAKKAKTTAKKPVTKPKVAKKPATKAKAKSTTTVKKAVTTKAVAEKKPKAKVVKKVAKPKPVVAAKKKVVSKKRGAPAAKPKVPKSIKSPAAKRAKRATSKA